MDNPIDDYDAIANTVQRYIDGAGKGDKATLEEAFHEQAWMFGDVSGTRYDVPISQMIDLLSTQPADPNGTYRARLVSVEQTGDSAVAVLNEDGFWGALSFVDYFLLTRIGGTWKIVSKVFTHTAGEMPPG